MKRHMIIPLAALFLAAIFCGCSSQPAVTEVQPSASQDGMEAAASLILDIPTTQYFTQEAVDPEDMNTILLAGANAPSAMNGQPWHFSAITDAAVIEQISGGMSFGGAPAGMTGMPEGVEVPEGMGQSEGFEMPEGAEIPEGMGQPEGFEMPEDGEIPEGMGQPEGFEMPEDGEIPEGMNPPEGFQMPEGSAPGNGGGNMPTPPTGSGTSKAGIEDAPLVIVISCKAGSEFDAGLACQNMSAEAQLLGYGTKIVSAPTMAINAEGQEALRATLGIPEGYTACALLLVGKADTTVDTTADTYAGATARNPLSDVVTYLAP